MATDSSLHGTRESRRLSDYARIGALGIQGRGTKFPDLVCNDAEGWPQNHFPPEQARQLADYLRELADDAERGNPAIRQLADDLECVEDISDILTKAEITDIAVEVHKLGYRKAA